MLDYLGKTTPPYQIAWIRNGLVLEAHGDSWYEVDMGGSTLVHGIRKEHMDAVADWCSEVSVGNRIAFNKFEFDNENQITIFLIRWSE
jgi:hypothetical protein